MLHSETKQTKKIIDLEVTIGTTTKVVEFLTIKAIIKSRPTDSLKLEINMVSQDREVICKQDPTVVLLMDKIVKDMDK